MADAIPARDANATILAACAFQLLAERTMKVSRRTFVKCTAGPSCRGGGENLDYYEISVRGREPLDL